MDYFANKIKSSTVSLSAQDALLSFANHPLVHFYENIDARRDFMPTAALKESLFMALCDFPPLLGFICDANDGMANVVVDNNNLNMPDFQETLSTVHYSVIKDAQFDWATWPANVATVGPATAPNKDGTVKLLNVHVVRLAENSGVILFCNIPHYILDGVGFYEFLGHWGMLCRSRCRSSSAEEPVATSFNFDRSSLAASLQGSRRPLDDMTRDILLRRSVISRLLTLLPFATRTRLVDVSMEINYGVGRFFHVSEAALNILQDIVKEQTVLENDLSSYSLLTALFRMSVSWAQQQQDGSIITRAIAAATSVVSRVLSVPQNQPHTLMNIVHTHRLHSPEMGCYIGNSIYMYPIGVQTTHSALSTDAKTFTRAAVQISQAMDNLDRPLLGEFYDMVSANPHAYANISAYMSAHPTALSVIDERHYKTSSADFGDGGPTWISGLPHHMPNFVAYFAASKPSGGTNIYVSLKQAVLDKLLEIKFFTTHAKVLF